MVKRYMGMTDRQTYIEYLVFFTNKTEASFEKMSDEQVEFEYKRLILVDR